MTSIRVFDPAMCCSSGVCGTSVDPRLARFAADLDWLKGRGVVVERFNLSQQPAAFAADAAVMKVLGAMGEAGLPLVAADGAVKSCGVYPSRDELAAWAGLGAAGGPTDAAPTGCCAPGSAGAAADAAKKSGCC